MSYFSQSKGERDTKNVNTGAVAAKPEVSVPVRNQSQDSVSTLGPGLLITGNVVSTGSVQISGRVIGDIHAARLLIGKGAQVEGKVVAQEAVIDGDFKGTIHSNSVKLQATAKVDGEIFNNSLVIEENAQFEGVARRLTSPVAAPTKEQISGEVAAPALALAPEQVVPSQSYSQSAAAGGNGLNGGGVAAGLNGSAAAETTY